MERNALLILITQLSAPISLLEKFRKNSVRAMT
jgi:hypothetical protein